MFDNNTAIHWTELQVGQEYYTRTIGYNPVNPDAPAVKITINEIWILNPMERMILAGGAGYAVGGMFEGDIGPQNRFWRVTDGDIVMKGGNAAAAAA